MFPKDRLFNGPTIVRIEHKKALNALRNDDYSAAAHIFETTLRSYPKHPDATYFLGLIRIYQGQWEEGFALLKSYRDPDHYRMSITVQRMAAFLEKRTHLTPKKIHETMNRAQTDGYNQGLLEVRDTREW